MGTQINWAQLVKQDRAKAHGIPWTEEEEKAIAEGMSPDDVRAGLLTQKDKDEVKEKKLRHMNKQELVDRAKSLGLEFDEIEVTRGDLILEIEKLEAAKLQDTETKTSGENNT